MKREGRGALPLDGRISLLEGELTDHEETVADQIAGLRVEMKNQAEDDRAERKEQAASTNRLLFGILFAILTLVGGVASQAIK